MVNSTGGVFGVVVGVGVGETDGLIDGVGVVIVVVGSEVVVDAGVVVVESVLVVQPSILASIKKDRTNTMKVRLAIGLVIFIKKATNVTNRYL
jgi:hypothetical protein